MDSQVLTPFSSSTFHKTQFSALGQTFVKQKSGKFPWGALFKIIQKLRIKVLEKNGFFKSLARKPTEVPGSATHYKIFEIGITFLLILYYYTFDLYLICTHYDSVLGYRDHFQDIHYCYCNWQMIDHCNQFVKWVPIEKTK